MIKQDLAILFSGGTASLSLYVLAALKKYHDVPSAMTIHLLHMLNGVSRFHEIPYQRFKTAEEILKSQTPQKDPLPESTFIEIDISNLFQRLWIDKFEDLMPKYNHKNLICVACNLAMHTRAIVYCMEHSVPNLLAGHSRKQSHLAQQSEAFVKRLTAFSQQFGINTRFPLYDDADDEMVTRLHLHDHGIPSTGGGNSRCLFAETLSTATETEIERYLDDVLPELVNYVESRLEGRIRDTAMCITLKE